VSALLGGALLAIAYYIGRWTERHDRWTTQPNFTCHEPGCKFKCTASTVDLVERIRDQHLRYSHEGSES